MDENLKNIKVFVKNISGGGVSYILENRHIRREWLREGQVIPIPADELQEAIYDQGIYNLFLLGYLGIDNPDHRKLIGLEYDGGEKIIPVDRKKMEELLSDKCDLAKFEQELYTMRAKPGRIDLLMNVGCDIKSVDYNKQRLIKEILGIDLTALIKSEEE